MSFRHARASASPRTARGPAMSRRSSMRPSTRTGPSAVPEVVTAVDCGFCVNPERIRSQIEGAAVMGMSNTLYSGITFKGGAVEQSNFTDYAIAAMSNYPKKVTTVLVDAPAHTHAGGIGEPGVPPFSPALCNAVFAATNKRLRSLPTGDKIS